MEDESDFMGGCCFLLEQTRGGFIVCLCVEGDVYSDVVLIFIEETSGQPCSGGHKSRSSVARAPNKVRAILGFKNSAQLCRLTVSAQTDTTSKKHNNSRLLTQKSPEQKNATASCKKLSPAQHLPQKMQHHPAPFCISQ